MTLRYEQFAAVRRQTPGIVLSPDGTQVVYISDMSGQFNVWRQSVDGGWPYQLTLFEDWSARVVACSPRGDRLAVLADKDGSERYQIYLVPMSGGSSEPITDRLDVQYHIFDGAFSPDGSKLLYAGNELKPADNAIFVRDLASGETRALAEGFGFAFGVNWSPNGRWVTVLELHRNTDMDIHLIDVETGRRRLVTEHQGEVVYRPGPWLPDGSAFYVLTDQGREFKGLALLHVETGDIEWVQTPDWDVEAVELSEDGTTLMWSVNEDGVSVLYLRDLGAARERPVRGLPAGQLFGLALSPDGDTAVAQTNATTHGTDLYTLHLARGTVNQITFGMLGGVPQVAFVEPEIVHFETFDGRQIPALLYKPPVALGGQIPVVLSIHGGPESQERPVYAYTGLYQYMAYRGVAVLAPNIRGSSGYGKSYQRLIYHDWGGEELKDLEHTALYLLAQDWVDPERIGVFGASFGGFATLSCVTRLPQYWAAAVDVVGPSNLVTFVNSVPPTWKSFTAQWVGDPETERDFLLERSPISYVDQIRCPLLVMQGANDYRVVKAESDQMVERIRARGGTVEYVVYEDEGHVFTRRTNQLEAMRLAADFFLERFGLANLLPGETPEAPVAVAEA